MSVRLASLVLALWLFLALLLVAIAVNAAHFSLRELLIPGAEPSSWIAPALVLSPPLLIAFAHRASPGWTAWIGWGLALLLGGVLAAILVLFSPSAYLGT